MNAHASPSFLIVDDNAPLCDIIVRVIRRVAPQAAVREADRVADALAALQTETFTALIVDYRLPDGDGGEVIRWARDHGHTLPIIVVSGLNVDHEMQEAGANYVLGKPFHIDQLQTIVRTILQEADQL